ncbi:MAG: DUF1579 domain-containing protein [Planctomycetes bacterium]|nr:DUF1579 domain-containing protein [Planctomycetota bacterium]
MKARNQVIAALVLGGVLLMTEKLVSQAGGEGAPNMAEVMELAQPGEEHELLATLAGEWEMSYSMWMEPGGEAMQSRGEGTARMILGGRFLELQSTGLMMGMKTESLQILGFDRRHGEFTAVGFDTMGTYYVTARGAASPDAKFISMSGTDEDPQLGRQVYRFEIEIKSADEYVFSVVFTELGPMKFADGFKMVEVVARRKKA